MRYQNRGFSLIELMVSISVLALLLSVGVPNFRDFLRNARITAVANDLIANMHIVRSEAIKRRVTVTVCSGSDGAPPSCDDSSFNDGWIAFVDADGDGDYDNGADELLLAHDALPDTIASAVFEPGLDDPDDPDDGDWTDSDIGAVTYAASGFRSLPAGALPTGIAIVLCDARGNVPTAGGPDISAARMIEITSIGRAAVTRNVDAITARGGCPEA